jgi:hypothetical protein
MRQADRYMWRNLRGTFWIDKLEGRGLGADVRMTFVIYVREMAVV